MSGKLKSTNPLARLHAGKRKRAKSPWSDSIGSVLLDSSMSRAGSPSKKSASYLAKETKKMGQQRREIEHLGCQFRQILGQRTRAHQQRLHRLQQGPQ